MRLLLIEDDADVAANIWEYFEERADIVDRAADGLSGLHLAATSEYDVIVVDIGLPGVDGLTLTQHLRASAKSRVPIIMLTARDTVDNKLQGFAAGTDDYLVKPFALAELAARVDALVARTSGRYEPGVFEVDDLSFDTQSLRTRRAGLHITLTRSGYLILEHLMRNTHRVVRRADLEQLLWGDDMPSSDALRSHIHAVRKAVDRPFAKPLLHTVAGIGYRLCEPHELHK